MTQYIDKAAVVAEIEKRINEIDEIGTYLSPKGVLTNLLCHINTLEVKEVDLEKELENLIEKEKAFVTDNREVKYYNGDSFNHIYELEFIAKHFFELGLRAQKGE